MTSYHQPVVDGSKIFYREEGRKIEAVFRALCPTVRILQASERCTAHCHGGPVLLAHNETAQQDHRAV